LALEIGDAVALYRRSVDAKAHVALGPSPVGVLHDEVVTGAAASGERTQDQGRADSDEPVSCHLAHFPFGPRGSTVSGQQP
jgi:hypothetical protein